MIRLIDFDLIVIGSGAGGGTLAAQVACQGKRVLLIERGRAPQSVHPQKREIETVELQSAYDNRLINVNGNSRRLMMGGVIGGSTSLFGAALLRPSQEDFCPGRYYGDRIPREIWEWPIDYPSLAPYYDLAEQLFFVHSDPEDTFDPLHAPTLLDASKLLPLAPINLGMRRAAIQSGLHPFRLPLAINAETCLRCDSCAGFLCPNGSRRSSRSLLMNAQNASHDLTLLSNSEVEKLLLLPDGSIDSVLVRDQTSGLSQHLRASCYVLAAGAIGSPAIMLRSGFRHPLIGRNYMLHYSPVVVGFFRQCTNADQTFVKQLGFADFYFGTSEMQEKMGIIQSLPAPGPMMLGKSGLWWLPNTQREWMRRHMLPLAATIEDLPDPNNRVGINDRGGIYLEHRYGDFDRQRGHQLAKKATQILKLTGRLPALSIRCPLKVMWVINVAHFALATIPNTQWQIPMGVFSDTPISLSPMLVFSQRVSGLVRH